MKTSGLPLTTLLFILVILSKQGLRLEPLLICFPGVYFFRNRKKFLPIEKKDVSLQIQNEYLQSTYKHQDLFLKH